MYDSHLICASPSTDRPRCSITTFLYRIAFTVLHASFFIENVGLFYLELYCKKNECLVTWQNL